MPIRLLIVDDHLLIRESLRLILDETDVVIVGEATSVRQALEQIGACTPDIVLLDISLPDGDGFAVLIHISRDHPLTRVIMHSIQRWPHSLETSRRLGARGYINKGTDGNTILKAIRSVHAGQEYWGDVPETCGS